MISVSTMRPFTRCLMTIGMIPTSYLVSMTYEEQLLWLCNYLEKEVIPALNNNAEALKEVQDLYVELKKYVDDYFSNLDVQEEINNKLDEMATDGTLDRIINQEIFGELNNRIETLEDKSENEMKYHFISTGDNMGDCVAIQTENECILYDLSAATNATNLINYLTEKGISKIDKIVISHFHHDHIGGANAEGMVSLVNSSLITEDTKVYLPTTPDFTLFVNDPATEASNVVGRVRAMMTAFLNACSLKNLEVNYMTTNETLEIDNATFRFLNCSETEYASYYNITETRDNEHYFTCYNNFSMILEITNGSNVCLLTGDIEEKAQEVNSPFITKKISLKKIPHHSVNRLSNSNFLRKTNAKINVYMNRANDSLKAGLLPDIISNFIAQNQVYSTGFNGTMEFIDDGKTIVSTKNLTQKIYDTEVPVSGFDSIGLYGLKNLNIANFKNTLKENDDLNDIRICGDYNCLTAAVAGSLVNSPVTNAPFKLTVEFIHDANRLIQKVNRASIFYEEFVRYYDGEWHDWQRLATREHLMATNNSPINLETNDYETINFENLSGITTKKLSLENGRVVSNYSGVYKIEGHANVTVDDGDIIHTALYVNGVRVNRNDYIANGTNISVELPSWIVNLSASQYAEFKIYNETKKSLVIGASSSIVAYEV